MTPRKPPPTERHWIQKGLAALGMAGFQQQQSADIDEDLDAFVPNVKQPAGTPSTGHTLTSTGKMS